MMKWLLGHSFNKILSTSKNVYKIVRHMDNANNAIIVSKTESHKSQDFYRKIFIGR